MTENTLTHSKWCYQICTLTEVLITLDLNAKAMHRWFSQRKSI